MLNFNVMGMRKTWFVFSGVLILLGLISLLWPGRGLNLGIDFTGGSSFEILFEKPVTTSQVRQVLAEFGLEGSSIIQDAQNPADVIVQTRSFKSEEDKQALYSALEEKIGPFQELESQDVSPVISRELVKNALLALLVAGVGILFYVSYRFEFWFGLAALVALVHDALITLGFFSLLQVEIGVPFVAAVLTILGYSINDTIVVFDRVRENLKSKKKATYEEIANISVRQTFVRSINTSATTLIMVLFLLLVGGRTIQPFTLAMLIGITAGTYSSIFVATPVWVSIREFLDLRKGRIARVAGSTE